jgi:hypothetical protein
VVIKDFLLLLVACFSSPDEVIGSDHYQQVTDPTLRPIRDDRSSFGTHLIAKP